MSSNQSSDMTETQKKVSSIKATQFSVVVPIYNEEGSLPVLFDELSQTLKDLNQSYELVFINDCSSDNSEQILNQLQQENPQIVHVHHLKSRSGQTHALKYGIQKTQGSYVITMDGDLQNDPADIPRMIEQMNKGFDCVCGWRKDRQDTPLKAGLSKLGNVLQRLFTGTSIHDVSCTLRIYRRECALKIPLNWEGQHRFIPLCLSLQGYKIGEIVSHHRERRYGATKYSHKRIFRVIADFFKILKTRGQS